jgi:hypothetical protein
MSSPRPTPFDLVFADTAGTTFPDIGLALSRSGTEPRDRDAFLMAREVVSLLRELRPEEGLGEGIDQLAALVHHSYLFWAAGCPVVQLTGEQLGDLLGALAPGAAEHPGPAAYYVQFPERRIWAQAVAASPPEPLDGCFIYPWPDETSLRVLGVLGLHAERAGFTVVEVAGPHPFALHRPDGSRLFSPTLPGGAAAGLFSLAGEEELLELGWRTRTLPAVAPVEAS